MSTITIKIEPADHGRRMGLIDFESAGTSSERIFELGRGVVTMIEVPGRRHVVKPPEKCQTRLLPGFDFDVGTVFRPHG